MPAVVADIQEPPPYIEQNGVLKNKPVPMDRHFIETDIYYTKKEDHLDTDKPYMLRYKDPNRPPTNMETETRANTKIRDMRTIPNLNLDEHGFDTMQYDSLMSYDQYENEETVMKIHVPQIEEVLRKHYGAKRVESVRHKIRRRDPNFRAGNGIAYDHHQPAPMAHIDISAETGIGIVDKLFGDQVEKRPRFTIVNVWKPLRGPVYDWPLAMCDAATTDFARDLRSADLVWPERNHEYVIPFWHPDHTWYYFRGQTANDLLVIRMVDSRIEGNHGTVHTAIDNPQAAENCTPRESIEVEAVMFFDDDVEHLERVAKYPIQ